MSILLPMASMGDIAFLLIIFFMLASSFMKTTNVVVEDAKSGGLESQEPALVNVVLDADGVIWLQGNPCSAPELTMAMKAQAESLRDHPVHVRIHRSHPRRLFMPVIEAISEGGVKMVLTGELEEN